MLKLCHPYKDQIEKAKLHILSNEEIYKYFICRSYLETDTLSIPDSDWESLTRVSVEKEKVLGYMSATINRDRYDVTCLRLINFDLTKNSFVFSRDIERFIDYLFMYKKFRKITFSVVVGNPAEKMYDWFITKFGGRVVGTCFQDVRLVDGLFYDFKIYEIMREQYVLNRRIKSIDIVK